MCALPPSLTPLCLLGIADNNRSAGNSAAPSFGGGGSRPKGVSDHHLFLLALCVPRTYKLCTNLLSKRFRFSSLFFFFVRKESLENRGGRREGGADTLAIRSEATLRNECFR